MPDRSHAPHVVVVDDKLEMAEMLAERLSDEGFSALAVATGKQALARIEAEPVDALVTDLRMPGMDGIELLMAARRPPRRLDQGDAHRRVDRHGHTPRPSPPRGRGPLPRGSARPTRRRARERAAAARADVREAKGPTFGGPVLPMRELQQRYARWAIAELGGNKTRTAERLEIDVKTLGKYLAGDASD